MIRPLLFAFLVVLLSLTGCATDMPRATAVVVQEQLTVVDVDPTYLQDCAVEPMLKPEDYARLGRDEREDFLTRLVVAQYKDIALCTSDKRHLRTLIERQKAEIDRYNAKQAALTTASKENTP